MTRLLAIIGALVVLLAVVFLRLREGERGSGSRASEPPSRPSLAQTGAEDSDAQLQILQQGQSEAEHDASFLAQAPKTFGARSKQEPSSSKKDGLTISGRVVDDLGTPVPSYEIELGRPGAERRDAVRQFASPDGSFCFDGLTAGQWQVTALKKGDHCSAPTVVSGSDKAQVVVLVVPRAATVSGFVLGGDGAPVANAKLYLHYSGETDIDFGFGAEPEPRTRTGRSGTFLLQEVLPGTVEIMARHPDHSDGEWIELELAPGQLVQDVEIVLTVGGRIEGTVDPSLGVVADREIGLFSLRGFIGWRNAHADATGRFVIENVVPQDYVIELRPAGYDKRAFQNQPGIRKNISVKEGETTQVVFGEPRRQIAIRGVVSTAGTPAPGLSVSPYPKENEDQGEEAKTGPEGRFELTVAGSGEYVFAISANYGSYVSYERTVPDQDLVEFAFEAPGGALSGRVLDSEGRSLGGVGITLVKSRYTDRKSFYRNMRTDRDGRFRFKLLEPGSYTLRAPDGFEDDRPAPRWPHGRVVMTDLVVGTGEVAGIKLHLPAESRIFGLVVDPLGNPVTDAWIGALDERGLSLAGDEWDARTDSTGHFQIYNVAPGTYSVRARSGEDEAKSASFEVEAGKTASIRIEIR